MAQPVVDENHPWKDAQDSSGIADHRISVLTGYYLHGSKEKMTMWRLNFWERLKVLFTGKVVFHCLEALPLHKLSTDYSYVQNVANTWNGDRRGLDELDAADFETRLSIVKKEFANYGVTDESIGR